MADRPTAIAFSTPYRYVVSGQDDPTKDVPAIQAAIASCHGDGGGTVWVKGTLYLNTDIYFSSQPSGGSWNPVSLRGFDDTATIKTSPGVQLLWGSWYDSYSSLSFTSINPVTTGDNSFTFSAGALSLSNGDYLQFASNDTVPDQGWHDGTWIPRSYEMLRYMFTKGASTHVVDHNFADLYSTSPRVAIMPMLKGVKITDIRFINDGGVTPDGHSFDIRNCADGCVEGCTFGDDAASGIWMKHCANFHIRHNTFGRLYNWSDSNAYTTLHGGCLNCSVHDNVIYPGRHAYTSGNATGEGGVRRGTNRGCSFRNNTVIGSGQSDGGGLGIVDTHYEGFETVIQGNTIHVGNDAGNSAIYLRARNTIACDNIITGGTNTRAALCRTSNCTFTRNTLRGFSHGPALAAPTNATCDNFVFADNTVIDLDGSGVKLSAGNNHSVVGNRFIRTSHTEDSTYVKPTHVHITGGLGHIIENNAMSKYTNTYSIYLENSPISSANFVRSNNCRGYGSGVLGVGGTNFSAWESDFASQNDTD